MSLDGCSPCDCISGNESEQGFYQKALTVLCGILTASGGGLGTLATYENTEVDGTGGGIPSAGILIWATTSKTKILTVLNNTDKDVLISLDGGTNYPYPVPASGGTLAVDLAANGLHAAGDIWAKAALSDTSSGVLYLGLTI